MVMMLPALFRAIYKNGDKLPVLFREICISLVMMLPAIFRAMFKYGDNAPRYI